MLRGLVARLLPGDSDSDDSAAAEQGESDEEGGFLRSRLDASVLFAHGMGGQTAEVEEPTVSEEEREVLDQYHDE